MKQIKGTNSIIDTQLETGYESGSEFRDAFSKIMGLPPAKAGKIHLLKADWLDSPVGPMLAIADEEFLYVLEFVSRVDLESEIEILQKKTGLPIVPGRTAPIDSIEKELRQYFEGKEVHFLTPIKVIGSPFQKEVWAGLQKIPYGQTCSYADLAKAIGRPLAVRAVGSANGANQLAIVIPCHRVINTNGEIGGYGGGIAKKKWLLSLEGYLAKEF